jgi:hypothetical protein
MAKHIKTTPILDGAYEIVGIVPGLVGTPIGMVDLSKLTIERAERLISIGMPYIRRVPPKPVRRSRAKKV